MLLAQLSDLHLVPSGQRLYGRIDTLGACEQALARIAALDRRPQMLVLSGDLADTGKTPEYCWLRDRLDRLGIPYCLLPGNHDRRHEMRSVFAGRGFSPNGLCCQRLDVGEGSLLLLDTVVEGEEAGEVAEGQLEWLNSACPAGRPTLLFMHHPPFVTGIAALDAIACRGSDRLAAWLEDRSNVEAILCGHVHRHVASRFAGRPALTAPSPAHQIALRLREGRPLAYTAEPGGLLCHLWLPGRSLTSHLLPIAAAAEIDYGD
jgi:3',5'-cyclic AMP phosphodiesterase CpdA